MAFYVTYINQSADGTSGYMTVVWGDERVDGDLLGKEVILTKSPQPHNTTRSCTARRWNEAMKTDSTTCRGRRISRRGRTRNWRDCGASGERRRGTTMSDYELTPEREKELEEAAVCKAKAENICCRLREAYNEAVKLCPPPYWESRRKKDTYERVISRLTNAYHHVSTLQSRYRDQDRRKKEEVEKKAAVEKEKIAAVKSVEYRDKAIQYLLDKGKKLGSDFTSDNAINAANNLAFELEVARRNMSPEPIDFDGQNCDGPCSGWTPGEHRCDCGNRRVGWCTTFGHSFETPSIYPEAY